MLEAEENVLAETLKTNRVFWNNDTQLIEVSKIAEHEDEPSQVAYLLAQPGHYIALYNVDYDSFVMIPK